MVYYKSYRIVDGKAKWVIEDENGGINKSPTKEQLKVAIICGWNPRKNVITNRKCCKCGRSETYIRPNGDPEWLRYKDKRGIWDGKSYVPSKYVNVSSITIRDTIKLRGSRWDKFRIEESPYNGAYQSLMYHLMDKEFFGVEDIKKWLDGGI